MTIAFEKPEQHSDWIAATHSAALLLIKTLGITDPASAAKTAVSAYPAIKKLVAAVKGSETKTPENQAWTWLSLTLAETVAQFLGQLRKDTILQGEKVDEAVSSFLTKALDLPSGTVFDANAFQSPASHPAFANARRAVPELIHDVTAWTEYDQPHWLQEFDDCIAPASSKVFAANHAGMTLLSDAVTGPTAEVLRKDIAWARHYDWIDKRFRRDHVFSPDRSVTTPLSDLYLRLRTYWHEQYDVADDDGGEPETRYRAYLGDLHQTVESWLDSATNDYVRIVAGGPGSGKSSFAKAIASEASLKGRHRTVFFELQQMTLTGDLYRDVGVYLHQRNRPIGDDGSPGLPGNPLDWFKTDNRPVFLVFDGLDEITHDTEAAKDIARKFVLNVDKLVNDQNRDGTNMRALVLGRDIACQSGIKAAALPLEIMLNVAPIRALVEDDLTISKHDRSAEGRVDFPDMPTELIRDQRPEYWSKWCLSQGKGDTDPPEAITHHNLSALNVEPLLLHLLILSDYCGDKWPQAAANRNVVYQDILGKIHARNVKESKPGKALTEKGFFLLMECLGLAAWHGNMRTGTESQYLAIREVHARAIKKTGEFEHADMDSMVLQTHARKVEGTENGFEFIHKSFGEYLTARALMTLAIRSERRLRNEDDPTSEHDIAAEWVQLVGSAELAPELIPFLRDEAKFRSSLPQSEGLKSALEDLLTWANTYGMPATGETYRACETVQRCAETALLAVGTSVAQAWETDTLRIAWGENNPIHVLNRLHITTGATAGQALSWLDLSEVALDHVKLNHASLFYANLSGTSLVEAHLNDTLLINANLGGANMCGVRALDAVLYKADLTNTLLEGADLRDALMMKADLSGANLKGANLSGTNLDEATVHSADFTGCNLAGAIVRSVDFTAATCDFAGGVSSMFGVREGYGKTILPDGIDYPDFWHVAETAETNSHEIEMAFARAYQEWRRGD